MTVVPFPRFRFTPEDIREFEAFARPRREAKRWSRIERVTTSVGDHFLITLEGTEVPFLSFTRNADGLYRVMCRDVGGWSQMWSGSTAEDCLSGSPPKAMP